MRALRITGLALIAAAAIAITGCTTAGHATSAPAAPTATATTAAPAAATSSPPASPAPFGRGSSFTYTDGTAVSVISATPAALSQEAAGGNPGDPAVIIRVRVTAGSAALDASDITVDANAGPDGTQLSAVFDANIDNPSGTLTPGQHGTYAFEFDTKHASWDSHIDVTVTPGFSYDAASFTGAAS